MPRSDMSGVIFHNNASILVEGICFDQNCIYQVYVYGCIMSAYRFMHHPHNTYTDIYIYMYLFIYVYVIQFTYSGI